jgi:hypothetical protein
LGAAEAAANGLRAAQIARRWQSANSRKLTTDCLKTLGSDMFISVPVACNLFKL